MEILLKIDGMHCGGCASAVSRTLSSVASVSAVTVDIGEGSATIQADHGVDRNALLAAVQEAGYDARIDR